MMLNVKIYSSNSSAYQFKYIGALFACNGPICTVSLGRDGVTITSFSSRHEVRTKPALYEKIPHTGDKESLDGCG